METIIYQHLSEILSKDNSNLLASYMDRPAVFEKNAPDDKDDNWNSPSQYPRVVFDVSMQADSERKIAGQLIIDVMCENNQEAIPAMDEIKNLIRSSVDGCFFSTSDLTISAQWDSNNDFVQDDDKVIGTTIVYSILAYPSQITESPDPIVGTNLWIKTLYPNANVIGKDTLLPTWKATDEAPAIYCSLFKITDSVKMRSNACVDWFDADLHINVIAPSENVRATICKTLTQVLRNATRIILDDGSPMLINKITSNISADPLRVGQIQINATYGVLPKKEPKTKLQHAYLGGMSAESEV